MRAGGVFFEGLGDIEAIGYLDELADLYAEVYVEPPYNGSAKYSRQAFLSRTRKQIVRPGFALVTVREDKSLIGFAFGFQMGPGEWWANAALPSSEVLRASKFAVIEFVVDSAHRGLGIGSRLAQRLLGGRSEQYATLAAVREAPAHEMYLRWGWTPVARFTTPPYADAMIRPLTTRR